MRLTIAIAVAVSIILIISGCSSVPTAKNTASTKPQTSSNAATNTRPDTVAASNGSVDPLNDPHSILAGRSAYFAFDSSLLRNQDKPLIAAHGNYLAAHKDRKVIIQGNTDERGSAEYNLALGQKRAEEVRKAFALSGVQNSRMEVISYGKEKPKAIGHDENSWAQNRRADIVYQ